MIAEIKDLVAGIDCLTGQRKWFDFQVLNYDGSKLTITRGIDLSSIIL